MFSARDLSNDEAKVIWVSVLDSGCSFADLSWAVATQPDSGVAGSVECFTELGFFGSLSQHCGVRRGTCHWLPAQHAGCLQNICMLFLTGSRAP